MRGVVQSGEMSFRASLVVKSDTDIENLCGCREAREWGKICAHAVGVGLHWFERTTGGSESSIGAGLCGFSTPRASQRTSTLVRDSSGEAADYSPSPN